MTNPENNDIGYHLREALIQYDRIGKNPMPAPTLDEKTIARIVRLSSDHAWWSTDDIATILGVGGRNSSIITELINGEDFPAPLTISEGRGYRRWQAKEVLDFLKKKRDAVYLA